MLLRHWWELRKSLLVRRCDKVLLSDLRSVVYHRPIIVAIQWLRSCIAWRRYVLTAVLDVSMSVDRIVTHAPCGVVCIAVTTILGLIF